jgi:hypothetical protein
MPKTMVPPTLVLVATATLASCVTVAPSQRSELAKPEMQPATAIHEEIQHGHVEAARQGAMGNHGVAGGGCGCG